jgi:hypothetical protein
MMDSIVEDVRTGFEERGYSSVVILEFKGSNFYLTLDLTIFGMFILKSMIYLKKS